MPDDGQTIKSTPEAVAAVGRMLTDISQGLTTEINTFKSDGDTLANPTYFQGPAASGFVSEWPGVKTSLNNVLTELTDLAEHLQKVNANIQAAGGNG